MGDLSAQNKMLWAEKTNGVNNEPQVAAHKCSRPVCRSEFAVELLLTTATLCRLCPGGDKRGHFFAND